VSRFVLSAINSQQSTLPFFLCHGAVDHFGRVFRDDTQAVHEGVYVADGSIIRSALEVNPFLTISALAERIVENIVALLTH